MTIRSGRAQSAGEATRSMLDEVFQGSSSWSRAQRINRIWRTMSSKVVKAHTCGVAIREHRVSKELVVYVDSNVWMVDFDMRKQDILQEWNIRCRGENSDLTVQKVSFRLARIVRDAGATNSMTTHDDTLIARVPLSEQEREQVLQQTSTITDSHLREHAQKAMISVLQWKKSNK